MHPLFDRFLWVFFIPLRVDSISLPISFTHNKMNLNISITERYLVDAIGPDVWRKMLFYLILCMFSQILPTIFRPNGDLFLVFISSSFHTVNMEHRRRLRRLTSLTYSVFLFILEVLIHLQIPHIHFHLHSHSLKYCWCCSWES